MIEVEFHGAAKTVTGSNFLVKTPQNQFVVDCGMFQGPDVEGRNLEPLAYDASLIDFALLTHAHIDHCGMLPKLYKAGFRGPIYATRHTIQIATLLLYDSAKIQESNYQRGSFYGKYTQKVAMAYNSFDAEQTIGLFKPVDFDEDSSPAEGIHVKFIRAGHILGAASIEVRIDQNDDNKFLLFSGDIGRVEQPLIESFDSEYRSEPDYIFMESLYGGTMHPSRQSSIDDFVDVINKTIAKGGNVYIPSFAVQRTQEILMIIKEEQEKGRIEVDAPVWLDSPLAQRVSKLYTEALEETEEVSFHFDNLHFVNRYNQSRKLLKTKKQIIIAGSGMADGGRIMNHLANGLEHKNNAILFVGYQAVGTLGRELVDGHKEVTIGDTSFEVRADVHYLHGFSAHGDTSDYVAWVKRHVSDSLQKVFLIHAEEDRARSMDLELDKINVMNSYIPDWKEKVVLS